MKTRKKTVLATALLTAVFLLGSIFYKTTLLPHPIAINTAGHPTIGTGPIEMVIFEDLCCTNCRVFTENIFPQITSQYVETGKARLTVVLISFGNHAKPLANAALAVYKIAPTRFLPFILDLLHSKAARKKGILQSATKVGGIDLTALAKSIDSHQYYAEIDHNLIWARSLMGTDFGTPTFFVNGVESSTDSFDDVVRRIKQIERQK